MRSQQSMFLKNVRFCFLHALTALRSNQDDTSDGPLGRFWG